MSVNVHAETVIHRPRSEVAAYMFDPRNDARWTSGLVECRPLTPGRLRLGSEVERVVRFLGRRFGYRFEVVAADADRVIEIHVERPFPMQVRYELEDVPGGTLARIRARGDAGKFFDLAAPVLGPMVRRNLATDLAELKRRLEEPRPS